MYGTFFQKFLIIIFKSIIKLVASSIPVRSVKVSQFCTYFIPPNLNRNSIYQTCRRKMFNFFGWWLLGVVVVCLVVCVLIMCFVVFLVGFVMFMWD